MTAPRIVDCARNWLGRTSLCAGLLFGAAPDVQAAAARVAVVALGDEAQDAFRGPLGTALQAPAGVAWLPLASCPAEDLPAALDRLGASGAVWARLLRGGGIGLRWYRRHPSELFEVAVPRPAGAPAAVAMAISMRLQFLMQAPAGTGRPWPPLPPVEPPLDPALVAAYEAPPLRPWPALPEIRLPMPPAALPGPPPPHGDFEIVIEARADARTPPPMIFSPTAEEGSGERSSTERDSAPAHPREPGVMPGGAVATPPTLILLTVDARFPRPGSAGGGLGLVLPALGGLAVNLGLQGHFFHEPWDTEVAHGALATLRATAALQGVWAVDEVFVWAGGGPFLATLVPTDSAGRTLATHAWQGGLALATRLGWDLGRVSPFAGFMGLAAPGALAAESAGVEREVSPRIGFAIEVGVALPLGR